MPHKSGNFDQCASAPQHSSLSVSPGLEEPDFFVVVKFIAIQRLKWAGHLLRLDDNRIPKKIFMSRPYGTRKRRSGLRRIDFRVKYFKTIFVRNWKSQVKNRAAGNEILRKAKANPGLSSY
ncbi:hypothetical protein TNCV_4990571 [Trichonephila clavipes]|nr:hypothetical protein TNCV_4990571 [Trichonephila clavipes]